MADLPSSSEQMALQAHLAEYEAIWGEIHAQLALQSNLLNYVIALIAAGAALISLGNPALATRVPWLLLVASVLLLAMAWALIDASYQLNDLGAYNEQVVAKKIQALIGQDVPAHLRVMQWHSARIYGGSRMYFKALLSAGKFAFAYVPGLALAAAYCSIRPPSQSHWTGLESALFVSVLVMAIVPLAAGLHNALFIRRKGAGLFRGLS